MLDPGQMAFAELPNRGIVCVGGADAASFLQSLVTNDVTGIEEGSAVWAALLTPQGKYLFDFFVTRLGGDLLLDCERARADDLVARLERFRLRAQVEIVNASEKFAVAALLGGEGDSGALVGFEGRGGPFAGGVCFVDPRWGGIGARAILPRESLDQLAGVGFATIEPEAYEHARLCAGLPDGSRDLPVEKALPMENSFDALNGISWDKGCYVGQELTARMRYRGTAKRRLLPVAIEGPAPDAGTPIRLGDRDGGDMRSSAGGIGLALIRVEALKDLHQDGGPLRCGDATLSPLRPPWLEAPAASSEQETGEDMPPPSGTLH